MPCCPACGADASLSLHCSTVFLFDREDLAVRGKCESCPFTAFWQIPKDLAARPGFDLRAYLDATRYTILARPEAQPSTPDS